MRSEHMDRGLEIRGSCIAREYLGLQLESWALFVRIAHSVLERVLILS